MSAAPAWVGSLVLAGLVAALGACSAGFDRARFYQTGMVSHALGEIDGRSYLSCRECFERSHAAGHRYMEVDLMVASDGRLVAMHDGDERRFGLPPDFTSAEFGAKKLLGRYTPLDDQGIARLMAEKKDWYLVTDIKTDNRAGLTHLCEELGAAGIDCRERVLPQIYSEKELAITRALGFHQVILTLYRLDANERTFHAAATLATRDPDVLAITMPVPWWHRYGPWLQKRWPDLHVFVHTVNDPAQARALRAQGVTGVYSDTLTPDPLHRDPPPAHDLAVSRTP